MADFKIAYKKTAKWEGGYQCDPDDNGNWTGGVKGEGELVGTNYGVSAPLLQAYLKRTPTKEDMKHLSEETVENIYRKSYWNPIRGDEINDQESANQLYDAAINCGIGTAIKLCQRTLGLPETTVMTTTTLNKLNNKA